MAISERLTSRQLDPRHEDVAGTSSHPPQGMDLPAGHHDQSCSDDQWRSTPWGARVLSALPGVLAIVAAVLVATIGYTPPSLRCVLVGLGLGVLYLFAFRSPFESSVGGSVPTQPVLMGLLLAAPLPGVALTVLAAVLVGGWLDGRRRPRALLLEAGNALHVLAPVAVLWGSRDAQGMVDPTPAVLVAAVLAQLLLDGLSAYLADRWHGTPLREMVRPLLWTWKVDVPLAVLGWALVMAVRPYHPVAIALVAVPILLVRFLASDRETYLAQSIAMHDAYAAASAAARRDILTGVANRRGWTHAVTDAQARLTDTARPLVATVLCADLDRLKVANDIYGHGLGDALIRDFAQVLRECVPSDATVARLGGDEFAVLVLSPARRGQVDLVGQVREAMLAHRSDLPVRLSASLGQASCGPGGLVGQTLIEADEASRLDKEARRSERGSVGLDFPPGAPGVRGQGSPSGIRVFVR